ncbi:type II toxin-antitoxin system RelE/ParE family toxin [Phyllobacterium lublinensis]|uniref:type II toxin-antitoxin system RelE/ParE family toxin n=1 Tax=Phyllobacterium lublinensis TaxID=2875708 RepID=UPI001CD017DA|nr:type II toxin-antitoxin system RelE/ParE family toxin [Phyllobacterium sp. 2063]MBZ9653397.1 type II toxin-antitoxin system RelE/ParE family toxin [Phyllobacterium sp. 2063]
MRWRVEILNDAISDELDAWPVDVRAALVRIVERMELVGLARLREPHVKHLRGKIWEMRPGASGKEGRALYVTARSSRIVIVAAFIKKGQKTPQRWLDLAEERAKSVT